jgi:ribose transport system permease protein
VFVRIKLKINQTTKAIIIALVIWFIFNFILTNTKIGRHMYAVGSNVEAAKMSGISVLKVTLAAYVVSAFCAGVVGLIQTAQSGTGDMSAGNTYELYAVAASVIGGVSTLGGQGLLVGTIVGAAIWSTLSNGLSLANVPIAIQNITVGIIVVISVLSDVIIRQRKK